jgi:hypothetical protein
VEASANIVTSSISSLQPSLSEARSNSLAAAGTSSSLQGCISQWWQGKRYRRCNNIVNVSCVCRQKFSTCFSHVSEWICHSYTSSSIKLSC